MKSDADLLRSRLDDLRDKGIVKPLTWSDNIRRWFLYGPEGAQLITDAQAITYAIGAIVEALHTHKSTRVTATVSGKTALERALSRAVAFGLLDPAKGTA